MVLYQMHTELSLSPLSALLTTTPSCLLQHTHLSSGGLRRFVKPSNSGWWKILWIHRLGQPSFSLRQHQRAGWHSYLIYLLLCRHPIKNSHHLPQQKNPGSPKSSRINLNEKRIFFTGSELEKKKEVKLKFKNKVKQKFIEGNLHSAWQGLKIMASEYCWTTPRTIQVE